MHLHRGNAFLPCVVAVMHASGVCCWPECGAGRFCGVQGRTLAGAVPTISRSARKGASHGRACSPANNLSVRCVGGAAAQGAVWTRPSPSVHGYMLRAARTRFQLGRT